MTEMVIVHVVAGTMLTGQSSPWFPAHFLRFMKPVLITRPYSSIALQDRQDPDLHDSGSDDPAAD